MTRKEFPEENLNEDESAAAPQHEVLGSENLEILDEEREPGEAEEVDEIQISEDEESAHPSRRRNLLMWGAVAAVALVFIVFLIIFLRSSGSDPASGVNVEIAPAADSTPRRTKNRLNQ